MFVLAEMKDVIRVTPEHFHQSLTESITTLLNRKLANKVVIFKKTIVISKKISIYYCLFVSGCVKRRTMYSII